MALALALPAAASAQGTLEGRITIAGSTTPLAGAQVSIPSLSMGGSSGPTGIYSVGDIPAGTHEVVFTLIGFQEERRQVTIADGQTERLNVSLAERALVVGGLVVVGTRAQPRTVTQSPVPVDVIPSGDIINQGATDFADLLRNVNPSFNVNTQPISDAATFARPANLRGLAPDHTLMLAGSGATARRSSPGTATASPTGPRAPTSRSSPGWRSGRPRCCATARPPSTAPTRSPA